jgi:serine/threonine-protein kinase ULK4
VAALGEYLFYAATQLDEENADTVWSISPEAVEAIFNQLTIDNDEVSKHYAVKTIENITAQSMSAGILFATLDIATELLGIYNSSTNEGLRISAAISVSHICKLNQIIFPTIFESMTCKQYCVTLCDGPARIQQAFITMLNIALTKPYSRLNDSLMEEPKFKEAMATLLENSNIIIKAKSLLTILLLFKMDPHWIILVDEFKFYNTCDRMSKDYSKYIQYCLLCLIDGVLELMPKILIMIKEDFTKYKKDKNSLDEEESASSKTNSKVMKEAIRKLKPNGGENLKGSMMLIIAVFDLLKSSLFRNKVIMKELIIFIGLILEN